VGKTPPFSLSDEPGKSGSPGEAPPRPMLARDFWTLDERGIDTLVGRLHQLESEELQHLARDLRRVLQHTVASGDALTTVIRRDAEPTTAPAQRPLVVADPPSTLIERDLSPKSAPLPAPQPPSTPVVRPQSAAHRSSDAPEPAFLAALPTHGVPARRSLKMARRVGLLLATASIAATVPGRFPVLRDGPPTSVTSGLELQTASPIAVTVPGSLPALPDRPSPSVARGLEPQPTSPRSMHVTQERARDVGRRDHRQWCTNESRRDEPSGTPKTKTPTNACRSRASP